MAAVVAMMPPDGVVQRLALDEPHCVVRLAGLVHGSADETAAKAKATGATLLKGPFDVPGAGRMAVMQDPTSAVFAIWDYQRVAPRAQRRVGY